MIILELFITIFAIAGFSLAYYIFRTKRTAPLICPLEGSCEQVVTSRYSKFFGIPVEILGMAYYGSVALLYGSSLFFPSVLPGIASSIALALTVSAFLFSMYLTGIQAFVVKHWCTWCLFSAGICTIIFTLALYIANTKTLDILRALF